MPSLVYGSISSSDRSFRDASVVVSAETIRAIPIIARIAGVGVCRNYQRFADGLFASETALALPAISVGIEVGILGDVDHSARVPMPIRSLGGSPSRCHTV
jgi:hypothetical protein